MDKEGDTMERREFLRKGLILGAATVPATAVGASSSLFDCNDAIDAQTTQSIIESVAKSDVALSAKKGVIAVALRFDPKTMENPIVTAKGDNSLARLIWKTACEHSIPIVDTRWLVDCLFNDTEIGKPIPEITFEAVAKILNLVQKINSRQAFREYLFPEPLDIYIGVGLIPLADSDRGGDMLDRIHRLRKEIAHEIGIIPPRVRMRDSITLDQMEYELCIDGQSIAKGSVIPDRYLAIEGSGVTEQIMIQGIETIEPAYGQPAFWIDESVKELAQIHGYTVVEPSAVIITHFLETICKHADQILTVDGTQDLLDTLGEESPVIIEEVLKVLDVGQIHRVLQLLLKEQIPIRRLETILDVLLEHGEQTKDPVVLCKHVRQRLALLDTKVA